MRCSTTFLGLVLAPFAALAAAITAQPLVDADVLEPSVLNEVDHALGRAPTNDVPVSEASVDFAALWATNGASTTERAIALVSSQMGDGRWLFGGKDVTPVAARLLRQAAGYPEPPLNLPASPDGRAANNGGVSVTNESSTSVTTNRCFQITPAPVVQPIRRCTKS